MLFYVLLAAVNIACFVPLYLLNFRDAPNPFEFLGGRALGRSKLNFLYSKPKSTDPFRVNFDFTVIALIGAASGHSAPWFTYISAGVLAISFVEIQYTTVMLSIFKRAPVIRADIALSRVGLNIARSQTYWIVPVAITVLVAICFASYQVTAMLVELAPVNVVVPLVGALLLLLPGLHRWREFSYTDFLARTVYSSLLHSVRNFQHSKRVAAVLTKDAAYFARHNHFKDVTLRDSPDVVILCVESYGSMVYRDERCTRAVGDLVREFECRLVDARYRFASTYSEPPIFAGGSWLSYASFTYGLRFADVQSFDVLFAHGHGFGAYESFFHVLKRNGYQNLLLCPLAGIDMRTIDWAMIERCFQSDRNIDFASLDYKGLCLPFCGTLYAPPDQYSLNFAYEAARKRGSRPFSLFFCTLNSHIPWDSPESAVADWRALDDPDFRLLSRTRGRKAMNRYLDAIRYQVDYIFRFVLDHADDGPLVIVFGDHQPPLLTPEHLGKHTPVHVLSRNSEFLDVFTAHGFHPTIDLTGIDTAPMRHEGFLSLFMSAMNKAYGQHRDLEISYRAHGVPMFDEIGADA
jgi:hypothetical protein